MISHYAKIHEFTHLGKVWQVKSSPLYMETANKLIQSLNLEVEKLENASNNFVGVFSNEFSDRFSVSKDSTDGHVKLSAPTTNSWDYFGCLEHKQHFLEFGPGETNDHAKISQIVGDALEYCELAKVAPTPSKLDWRIVVPKKLDLHDDFIMIRFPPDPDVDPTMPQWTIYPIDTVKQRVLDDISEDDLRYLNLGRFLGIFPFMEPIIALPDTSMVYVENREIVHVKGPDNRVLPLPRRQRYFGDYNANSIRVEADVRLFYGANAKLPLLPLPVPSKLDLSQLVYRSPYFLYHYIFDTGITDRSIEFATQEFLAFLDKHKIDYRVNSRLIGARERLDMTGEDTTEIYMIGEEIPLFEIHIPSQDLWRRKPVQLEKYNKYSLLIEDRVLSDMVRTFGRAHGSWSYTNEASMDAHWTCYGSEID